MNKVKTVCIFGFPRSGTTWFSSILDSHPSIIYRHEPLVKLAGMLGDDQIHSLKYNHGLTQDEKKRLYSILLTAFPDVDRPPFFVKSHNYLPVSLKNILWRTATKFKGLEILYSRLAAPANLPENTLLIKETGWGFHLPSILDGLEPDAVLFLIRHPCAVVASFLNGFKLNLLSRYTEKRKAAWFKIHASLETVKKMGLDEKEFLSIDDIDFIALQWKTFYDICFNYSKTSGKKFRFIVYEELLKNPLRVIEEIMPDIGLSLHENISNFLQKSSNTAYTKLNVLTKDSSSNFYSVYRDNTFKHDAWKKELPEETINRVREIAGEEFLSLFR